MQELSFFAKSSPSLLVISAQPGTKMLMRFVVSAGPLSVVRPNRLGVKDRLLSIDLSHKLGSNCRTLSNFPFGLVL